MHVVREERRRIRCELRMGRKTNAYDQSMLKMQRTRKRKTPKAIELRHQPVAAGKMISRFQYMPDETVEIVKRKKEEKKEPPTAKNTEEVTPELDFYGALRPAPKTPNTAETSRILRVPKHYHIYYNLDKRDLHRVQSKFPTRALVASSKALVAFSSGARHNVTSEVLPSLEESLPLLPEEGCVSLRRSFEGPFLPLLSSSEMDEDDVLLLSNDFAGIKQVMAGITKSGIPEVAIEDFHIEQYSKGEHVPSERGSDDGSMHHTRSLQGDEFDVNCTICKDYLGGGTLRHDSWRTVMVSSRLQNSQQLDRILDSRMRTRQNMVKSPHYLAELGRTAEQQAMSWYNTRHTSPPRRAHPDQVPNIWENASTVCRERGLRAHCIVLYTRLLCYLETISAQPTYDQREVVHALRRHLITRSVVTQHAFFETLSTLGPKVIHSRDCMRILHFIRLELKVSTNALLRFVKRNRHLGWSVPRDLAVLGEKING